MNGTAASTAGGAIGRVALNPAAGPEGQPPGCDLRGKVKEGLAAAKVFLMDRGIDTTLNQLRVSMLATAGVCGLAGSEPAMAAALSVYLGLTLGRDPLARLVLALPDAPGAPVPLAEPDQASGRG
ncbi:hypothetical protein [Rhizobacter sp. SG703]|uniref:hypothetical protein n=1 Tax=Rhizobacter sp. SG703 TaxID=2587140 RepID=UPI001445498B|nr:hypothetical protein [Rhizobacter sp. SG703]